MKNRTMNSPGKNARIAGLLYLVLALTGVFSIMYVPSRIIVDGDAAATAGNILSNGFLYRAGMLVGLLAQVAFLLLALALYRLLRDVNKNQAMTMLALVVAAVPMACLNTLCQAAPLVLLNGSDHFSSLSQAQLNALVMLFLDLHSQGILITEIFWGLWLLPFGLLVIRSGFIPGILGILLILGGSSYLVDVITRILFPGYAPVVSPLTAIPSTIAEFSIMFWLLIKGARNQRPVSGEAVGPTMV